MIPFQILQPLHRRFGKGRGASGFQVDMHNHQLVGRSEIVLIGMIHPVENMHTFCIMVEDLRAE